MLDFLVVNVDLGTMENVSKEDSVLEEVKEKPKRRRRSTFAVKRRLSSFGDQLSSPHSIAAKIPEDISPHRVQALVYSMCLQDAIKELELDHEGEFSSNEVKSVCEKLRSSLVSENDKILKMLEQAALNQESGDVKFEYKRQLYEEKLRWKKFNKEVKEQFKAGVEELQKAKNDPIPLPPIVDEDLKNFIGEIHHVEYEEFLKEEVGVLQESSFLLEQMSKKHEEKKISDAKKAQECVDFLVEEVFSSIPSPMDAVTAICGLQSQIINC
ncbi:uncharacterized protein LOC136037290 isoform X1 [Artemia franciscana]|uniref:uncharacterized protein LOC136037290 isoform X1 n=1 Tax=Artemia franciscana TaxID=6661 RepID=UPI0032D9C3EB